MSDKRIIDPTDDNQLELYIHIPFAQKNVIIVIFCPSR